MAGTLGISFLIGASLSTSVASAFASVNDKIRATQQSFRKASSQSRRLSDAVSARKRRDFAARQASEQMRTTGRVDDSLRKELKKLNLAYMEAAEKAKVYGKSLAEITRLQNEMEAQTERTSRKLQTLKQVSGASNAMKTERDRRGAAVKSAFDGVAAAMSMAAPIKIGMEFESAMSRVGAISGAAGADFEALRSQARELGASTVWSAKEAAEGMTFLSMAGFKTHETLAAMPGMLSLASAGAMDLASTADIASNILSGFSFDASKMADVGNVLAKTFTKSNTSIASLGESFKYCAPVAANAGQAFESVAAMIGKLGDAGIQGSMAGTGLNAIIGRMAAPPKEASAALKKLGVRVADSAGKMRPMEDVFADIQKSMAKFSEEERIGLAKALYGAEHFAKGFVLQIASANGSLYELRDSLHDAKGYSDDVAKIQNNTFLGDLRQLNSAYQEVCITLFDVLNPALRQATQHITPFVQAGGQWIKENPRLVQGIALLGAAFVGLKAAGLAFTLINSYRKSFGAGIDLLHGQTKRATGGIRNGFAAVHRELARPIDLKGKWTSVTNGANSMQRSFGRLSQTLGRTWAGMRRISATSVLAGTKAAASGALASVGRVGWNSLRLGIKGVGMAFKTAFGPVSLLMMGLSLGVDYIIENWDKISPYFQALWDRVKAIFSSVMGWLQPIIDKIMSAIQPLIDGVKKVVSLGGNLLGWLGEKWDVIVGNDKERERKEKLAEEEARHKQEQDAIFLRMPKEAQQQLLKQNPGYKPPTEAALAPPREAALKTPAQMRQDDANGKNVAKSMADINAKMSATSDNYGDNLEEDATPKNRRGTQRKAAAQAGNTANGSQIVQPQVQVQLSVTQNGIPDAQFATGVMNAIKSRQSELEAMISGIVNDQARLAYG